MTPRTLPNKELLAALAASPRQRMLLAEFYRRFLPRMIFEAARILNTDARSASDIAHAALANILVKGSLRDLIDGDKLEPYLATAARRAALDFRRTLRREVPLAHMAELADWPAEPETERNAEALAAVTSVLVRLGGEDHRVLRLRYLEGKSLGELATILGVSYEAAAQRVSRALKRAKRLAKEN